MLDPKRLSQHYQIYLDPMQPIQLGVQPKPRCAIRFWSIIFCDLQEKNVPLKDVEPLTSMKLINADGVILPHLEPL